jgi:cobalamin biosynthesis protein CobT
MERGLSRNGYVQKLTIFLCSLRANNRDEQMTFDCDKQRMSSKNTSKITVKSEVTTTKKRKRGKNSDGDESGAKDDYTRIKSASTVKKEKSEVKSEVSEMPAKKRKRDNGDGDEDAKHANSDQTNDASERKKEKKGKQAKRHACSEPRCGKDFATPSALILHFRGHTGEKPFMCTEPGCKKTFAV